MSMLGRMLLVGVTVSLLAFPIFAGEPDKPEQKGKPGEGPQPVTEPCIITGDISSNGTVLIGTTAWTHALLDENGDPATLFLKANVLTPTGAAYPCDQGGDGGYPCVPLTEGGGTLAPVTEGEYYGKVRVLVKNGWFEFAFGPPLYDDSGSVVPCRPWGRGEVPPFGIGDNIDICPYYLWIHDGIYNRKLNQIKWEAGTPVSFGVFTLPLCQDSNDGFCVNDWPEYEVGVNPIPIGESIIVQFQDK